MSEKPLILCVDDEENILKSLKRILKNDFDVLTAMSADEGLKLFKKNQIKIMTIISDLKMPGKNGIDFLKEVKAIDQRVICIILSGQGDMKDTIKAINDNLVFKYLHKPWNKQHLIKTVKVGVKAYTTNKSLEMVQDIIAQEAHKMESFYEQMEDKVNISISDLKGVQERIARVMRLSEIGMVVSKIIHDMNNKLNIMSMDIELLKLRRDNNEDTEEIIFMMDTSLKTVAGMIDDIQLFITSRNMELKKDKINLKEAITNSFFDIQYLFTRRSITVNIDIPEKIIVDIDKDKFSRVVINLSKNAAEAMKEGDVFTILASANNSMVEIKFSDTGEGITQEVLENIFRPYATYKSGGVGMGLINVKEIVEMHRGSIDVKSKLGKGTSFIITFPCG
ncbi:MAG: hybrid sensor histidine kinase/response regulator [Candidatus Aureabacteria bacterium]|nr:hybrid sensor histidine kinase/response regulator [Candidatus Auribacterota bacterium]